MLCVRELSVFMGGREMPDYNFTLIETMDDIAFIHTLIYEAVEGLGGDDYDYDDCLDILGV